MDMLQAEMEEWLETRTKVTLEEMMHRFFASGGLVDRDMGEVWQIWQAALDQEGFHRADNDAEAWAEPIWGKPRA